MPYSTGHYHGRDSLIPPAIRGTGAHNERRARLLAVCLLVGPALGLVFSVAITILDPNSLFLNVPSVVASLIWWLWYLDFKKRGNFNFTANCTVALLNILVLYFNVMWGIASPVTAWAIASMVFGTSVLETRPALVHAGFLLVGMVTLLLLNKFGFYTPLQLPPQQQASMFVTGLITALCFAWLVTSEVRFLYDRVEQQLDREARTDMLTGLANRRRFFEFIEQQSNEQDAPEQLMAILIFDVDHLKQINDQHGHLTGDSALVSVAGALQQATQGTPALAARLAGDEFAIVMPSTYLALAKSTAEQVLKQVNSAQLSDTTGNRIALSVSVGIATLSGPVTDTTIDNAIAQADTLLFKSKKQGRNQFSCEENNQFASKLA